MNGLMPFLSCLPWWKCLFLLTVASELEASPALTLWYPVQFWFTDPLAIKSYLALCNPGSPLNCWTTDAPFFVFQNSNEFLKIYFLLYLGICGDRRCTECAFRSWRSCVTDFRSVYFGWSMDMTLNDTESNKREPNPFGIPSFLEIFLKYKNISNIQKDTENNRISTN